MDKIPLNYEASEGDTNKQTTATLPPEVVQCLENARFVGASLSALSDAAGAGEGSHRIVDIASPRDLHR